MSNSEFSIYFHHGGKVVSTSGGKGYYGGQLKIKRGLDIDKFGYLDLVDEVESIGYVSWDNLFFKSPKTHEFKQLGDDRGVLEVISSVSKGAKFISIYVDNGKVKDSETAGSQDDGNSSADSDNSSLEDDDLNPVEDSDTEDELGNDELVSDDEEYIEARENMKKSYPKSLIYDSNCDHKSLELVTGMRFEDGFQCRHVLQSISLEHGHPIRFIRCNKEQCEARCTPPCKWRCYGSVVKKHGYLAIKTLGDLHTCPRDMNNKLLTSNWIAKEFLETFRTKPVIKISELKGELLKRYGCDVSRWKLYRAKWKAQVKLRGTLTDHYARLRNYVAELVSLDKEGRFELLIGAKNVFKAFYVGFSSLKKGFLGGCRPVIGLDGCFLKTILGGVLMCAIAKDGNNQMYPIAWAVVEVENQSCWSWFLKILFEELGITDGLGYTFISDQQKGLLNALIELVPHAELRNCARHVYCNWKKQFKGPTLRNLFWRAARSTYVEAYKQALEDMRAEDEVAYLDFTERDPSKFCKALISTFPKSDMVDNNVSETFNGFILKARGKALIDMLEDIRLELMKRLHTKSSLITSVTDRICPKIRTKLEKNKYVSRLCIAHPSDSTKFEVHLRDDHFVVDISKKTCTCRSWDLTGIPCIHACSALTFLKVEHSDFVDDCFSVQRYIEAYKYRIEPTRGPNMWPIAQGDPVKPPLIRKMPGRPKKKRKRALEEKEKGRLGKLGLQMTCCRCGIAGHNKRTCRNQGVEPAARRRKRNSESREEVNTTQPSTSRMNAKRGGTRGRGKVRSSGGESTGGVGAEFGTYESHAQN